MKKEKNKSKNTDLKQVDSEKPFRYLKKLVRLNTSYYVIVPYWWSSVQMYGNIKKVWMSVYKDRIVIEPAK